MSIVRLDNQRDRIEISGFEINNSVIYNYFNNLPAAQRDEKLLRAIYIGVLALMEDRLSSFLSKTANELGTELESLKMIFDMKQELFFKSAIKGFAAEEDIAAALKNFLFEKKIKDRVELTGNAAGVLPKNKTGDIVCYLDGQDDKRIVIECKFDKSLRLGDIETKDVFTKKTDTAWSQLIEAEVNRDGKASIIVFDIALVDASILKQFDSIGYISEVGFVCVVDSQRGDYKNLFIAYFLARDIALSAKTLDVNQHVLSILMKRILKDLNGILSIKNLVQANIDNNLAILRELEKGMLLMEFNFSYLSKFLQDGSLTKEDLLQFYNGEEVKEKYRLIEKEIQDQIAASE
jgi:hypothetical protein